MNTDHGSLREDETLEAYYQGRDDALAGKQPNREAPGTWWAVSYERGFKAGLKTATTNGQADPNARGSAGGQN